MGIKSSTLAQTTSEEGFQAVYFEKEAGHLYDKADMQCRITRISTGHHSRIRSF